MVKLSNKKDKLVSQNFIKPSSKSVLNGLSFSVSSLVVVVVVDLYLNSAKNLQLY